MSCPTQSTQTERKMMGITQSELPLCRKAAALFMKKLLHLLPLINFPMAISHCSD